MTKPKKPFKHPKTVLMFNKYFSLVSMAYSVSCISHSSGFKAQSISFACSGKYISTNGHYFRYLPSNVMVDSNDLKSLNLQDYDKLCSVDDRRYHSRREMDRRDKTKKVCKKFKNKHDEHTEE